MDTIIIATLAPVLVIVAASVTSSPTFTEELRHINPHLMHNFNMWLHQYNTAKLRVLRVLKAPLANLKTCDSMNCTLVSMSTSFGMTSPSPSTSTKLVAFPRFPTLPVRPEHFKFEEVPIQRSKCKDAEMYGPILCTYSSTSSGMS